MATVGTTSIGPTAAAVGVDSLRVFSDNGAGGTSYVAASSGTANLIWLYCAGGGAARTARLVLYADDGSGNPGALVAVGAEFTLASGDAAAWRSSAISAPIVSGTRYHIGFWCGAGGILMYTDTTPTGTNRRTRTLSYSSSSNPSDPFGTVTGTSNQLGSVYVEYSTGTTVSDAGQGTLIARGSGADALTLTESGQGTSRLAGAGLDALTVADAGQGTSVARAGGADTATITEVGQGTLGVRAGGADTLVAAGAGQGTLAATAGGADAIVFTETGGAGAQGSAGGSDGWIATDAGQGTATGRAGAVDALVMTDRGAGVLRARAGGADVVPSAVGALGATLTARPVRGALAARTHTATLTALPLPTGALTARIPAATIRLRPVRGVLTLR